MCRILDSHGYLKSNSWTVILKKCIIEFGDWSSHSSRGPAVDHTVSVSGPTFKQLGWYLRFSTWFRKCVLFEQKHTEL